MGPIVRSGPCGLRAVNLNFQTYTTDRTFGAFWLAVQADAGSHTSDISDLIPNDLDEVIEDAQ